MIPFCEKTNTPLDRVIEGVRSRTGSASAAEARVSVAFLTVQAARHTGRKTGYGNTVLSLRVGAAVGSCAVESGELDHAEVAEFAGCGVDQLLQHPKQPVRVAALDAYLSQLCPHDQHPLSRPVVIPPGDSLAKSVHRAEVVTGLLRARPGQRVAVIGVVNSLLAALRERGLQYVPCDLRGGRTEWDEPVLTDHAAAISTSDAVLATGMTLGNGTFEDIADRCSSRGIPLTVFAQSGAAVFRELLGSGVDALSAEPYPFFWLAGGATSIYTYTTWGEDRP